MRKHFAALTLLLAIIAGAATAHTSGQTTRRKPPRRQPARTQSAPQKQTSPARALKPLSASSVLPSVDQILEKYVQAIGGRAAIRKLTSRAARGTFEITAAGISAPVESYEKAPNKTLQVIRIPGLGLIQSGYNGVVAFEQQPQSGLRELSGSELTKMKREADFYDDLNLKQHYTKINVTGIEQVGGSEAYTVEGITQEGETEKLYFNKTSGLLARKDESNVTPQGMIPTQAYFEDYRTVDGIKLPFTVRLVNPSIGSILLKLTDVKHNVEIDDAKFDKPAAP